MSGSALEKEREALLGEFATAGGEVVEHFLESDRSSPLFQHRLKFLCSRFDAYKHYYTSSNFFFTLEDCGGNFDDRTLAKRRICLVNLATLICIVSDVMEEGHLEEIFVAIPDDFEFRQRYTFRRVEQRPSVLEAKLDLLMWRLLEAGRREGNVKRLKERFAGEVDGKLRRNFRTAFDDIWNEANGNGRASKDEVETKFLKKLEHVLQKDNSFQNTMFQFIRDFYENLGITEQSDDDGTSGAEEVTPGSEEEDVEMNVSSEPVAEADDEVSPKVSLRKNPKKRPPVIDDEESEHSLGSVSPLPKGRAVKSKRHISLSPAEVSADEEEMYEIDDEPSADEEWHDSKDSAKESDASEDSDGSEDVPLRKVAARRSRSMASPPVKLRRQRSGHIDVTEERGRNGDDNLRQRAARTSSNGSGRRDVTERRNSNSSRHRDAAERRNDNVQQHVHASNNTHTDATERRKSDDNLQQQNVRTSNGSTEAVTSKVVKIKDGPGVSKSSGLGSVFTPIPPPPPVNKLPRVSVQQKTSSSEASLPSVSHQKPSQQYTGQVRDATSVPSPTTKQPKSFTLPKVSQAKTFTLPKVSQAKSFNLPKVSQAKVKLPVPVSAYHSTAPAPSPTAPLPKVTHQKPLPAVSKRNITTTESTTESTSAVPLEAPAKRPQQRAALPAVSRPKPLGDNTTTTTTPQARQPSFQAANTSVSTSASRLQNGSTPTSTALDTEKRPPIKIRISRSQSSSPELVILKSVYSSPQQGNAPSQNATSSLPATQTDSRPVQAQHAASFSTNTTTTTTANTTTTATTAEAPLQQAQQSLKSLFAGSSSLAAMMNPPVESTSPLLPSTQMFAGSSSLAAMNPPVESTSPLLPSTQNSPSYQPSTGRQSLANQPVQPQQRPSYNGSQQQPPVLQQQPSPTQPVYPTNAANPATPPTQNGRPVPTSQGYPRPNVNVRYPNPWYTQPPTQHYSSPPLNQQQYDQRPYNSSPLNPAASAAAAASPVMNQNSQYSANTAQRSPQPLATSTPAHGTYANTAPYSAGQTTYASQPPPAYSNQTLAYNNQTPVYNNQAPAYGNQSPALAYSDQPPASAPQPTTTTNHAQRASHMHSVPSAPRANNGSQGGARGLRWSTVNDK